MSAAQKPAKSVPAVPTAIAPSSSQEQQFMYLDTKGQQQGPVNANQIKQLLLAGLASEKTLIWSTGMPAWQPIEACKAVLDNAADKGEHVTADQALEEVRLYRMSNWYFVDKDEDERGPHSLDELKMFWYEGQLDGMSKIKCDQHDWVTLADWIELKTLFQSLSGAKVPIGEGQKADEDMTEEEKRERDEKRKRNREKRDRKKLQKQGKAWVNLKHNSNAYVDGLPDDVTAEEIANTFSKYGALKMEDDTGLPRIKIYKTDQGFLKGDALISFMFEESVDLAIQVLDGTPLRPGHPAKMKITKAVFKQKGETYQPKDLNQLRQAEKLNRAKAKQVSSWGESGEVGSLRIVVIKNMFDPKEFEQNREEEVKLFGEEVQEECTRFGEVERVTVFDRHPAGPVAVKFKESSAADACIEVMNGRWFAERQLTATFFDGTDYRMKDQEKAAEEERFRAFQEWLENSTEQNNDDDEGESPEHANKRQKTHE